MGWKRKLATVKSLKADISSVSPSSGRYPSLWQRANAPNVKCYCDTTKILRWIMTGPSMWFIPPKPTPSPSKKKWNKLIDIHIFSRSHPAVAFKLFTIDCSMVRRWRYSVMTFYWLFNFTKMFSMSLNFQEENIKWDGTVLDTRYSSMKQIQSIQVSLLLYFLFQIFRETVNTYFI